MIRANARFILRRTGSVREHGTKRRLKGGDKGYLNMNHPYIKFEVDRKIVRNKARVDHKFIGQK